MRKKIFKWTKRLGALVFVIGVIICLTFYFLFDDLVKSQGVTYTELQFHFPSTLELQHLKFENDVVLITADSAQVNWNWSALLSGKIKGHYLKAEQLLVFIKDIPPDPADTGTFHFSDIIPIEFDLVTSQNGTYRSYFGKDSIVANVPKLYVTQFTIDEGIHVDSLYSENSKTHLAFLKVDTLQTKEEEPLSFSHFPFIETGHLILDNSEITLYNTSQQHKLTQVHLDIFGIDSKNPLDFKLNQLQLDYQDTIRVMAHHDEFFIDNSGLLALNGLSVQIPGLDFNLKSSSYDEENQDKILVNISDSKINSSLLAQFIEDFPLKRNEDIHFQGGLSKVNDEYRLEGFQVAIAKSNISAIGKANINDSLTTFDFEEVSIVSSLKELQTLFHLSLPPDQEDVVIETRFSFHGGLEDFLLGGCVSLNSNKIQFDGNRHGNLFSLNALVEYLNPNDLNSNFPEELSISGLNFQSGMTVDSTFKPEQINGNLSFHQLNYDDQTFDEKTLAFSVTPNTSSFSLVDNMNQRVLSVMTHNNLFADEEIAFSGEVHTDLPKPLQLEKTAGILNSAFDGHFFNTDESLGFNLQTQDFQFAISNTSTVYKQNFKLQFENHEDGRTSAILQDENKVLMDFKSDATLGQWLNEENKFKGALPNVELLIKMNLDSALTLAFTNTNASFNIEDLHLYTQGDTTKLDLECSELNYTEYRFKNLSVHENFSENQLFGSLNIDQFHNPYTDFSELGLQINTVNKNRLLIDFTSSLDVLNKNISFGLEILDSADTYHIKAQKNKPIVLGNQNWQIPDSSSIQISKNYKWLDGSFRLENNAQKISLTYTSGKVDLTLIDLNVGDIYNVLFEDSAFSATANLEAHYSIAAENLEWKGELSSIVYDSLEVGTFEFSGIYQENKLKSHYILSAFSSSLVLDLSQTNGPLNYNLQLHNFELSQASPLLNTISPGLETGGMLSGALYGTYDETLSADGHIRFKNVELAHNAYGIWTTIPNDSIAITKNYVRLNNLNIYDRDNKAMTVDGKIGVAKNDIQLKINTPNFILFNKEKDASNFWGTGSISSHISIKGNKNNASINGNLTLKENTSINYNYESSVSIDELSQEILFVSANAPDEKKVQKKNRLKKNSFLKWNLDLDIERTDLYVLLFETTNDYVKLKASGQLKLQTGDNNIPNIYGEVKSTDGSIFYDAPMVSDLNLKIQSAYLRFTGDYENPIIAFKGYETFRVAESEITNNSADKNRLPIKVITSVEESPLSEFQLAFDLQSDNATAGTFIESLPKKSREVYATNLLVFGSLNGVGAGNTLFGGLISKLNEITRRNIKNADLSFYVDAEKNSDQNTPTYQNTENIQKLGYNYSQNLFDEKVRITLGGEMNFGQYYDPNQKQFNPLENVQIDYILSRHPEFYVTAQKHDSYRGAVEGQVDEYSLGFTYGITFKNFFIKLKKRAKENN